MWFSNIQERCAISSHVCLARACNNARFPRHPNFKLPSLLKPKVSYIHVPTYTKTMASRPPVTKRSTTTPSSTLPAERPPCKIDPTAVIADKAQITGSFPVEIGEHAVLHPYARVRAEGGRVTIGAYCVIAESAIVGFPEGRAGDVVLDRYVGVESGAEVLGKHVGEGTEVGVQSRIGEGAVVGRFCRLTATEAVGGGETVGDFTVVFGDGQRRRDKTVEGSVEVQRQRVKAQEKHVEVLKKLIPDGKAKWLG